MTVSFNVAMAKDAFGRFAEYVESNKEMLSDLDSQIGDGDHGINMTRGVKRVIAKIKDRQYDTLGALYRDIAINFMDAVGGYSGPLWGVFLMRIAQELAEKALISTGELAGVLFDGTESLMTLGNAKIGDKTIADALLPAAETLRARAADGDETAWQAAIDASWSGVESTESMTAKHGRGAFAEDPSFPTIDAGAMSAFYFIESLHDTALGLEH